MQTELTELVDPAPTASVEVQVAVNLGCDDPMKDLREALGVALPDASFRHPLIEDAGDQRIHRSRRLSQVTGPLLGQTHVLIRHGQQVHAVFGGILRRGSHPSHDGLDPRSCSRHLLDATRQSFGTAHHGLLEQRQHHVIHAREPLIEGAARETRTLEQRAQGDGFDTAFGDEFSGRLDDPSASLEGCAPESLDGATLPGGTLGVFLCTRSRHAPHDSADGPRPACCAKTTGLMHGKAAICGIGESSYYRWGGSPQTEFQLACTAIRRAVEDAGLALTDIDGFVSYTDQRNIPTRLARALGLRELRWAATTWPGGGNSVAAAVQIADAAVSDGYARHVVVFRALAQGQFGRFGQAGGGYGVGSLTGGPFAWNGTYGLLTPAQQCALRTARFMHDHGISQQALCEIALACNANAQRNPRALRYGKPLTREAYHASRWIVTPFHLYDCCPENDGAAACVVTTAERALDLPRRSAAIIAAAQGIGPTFGHFRASDLASSFYGQVADHLWQAAGLSSSDIDVAQFYENFTGPVLMALCEMGFTTPDGVEEFVSGGALAGPDAKLPFNTSGGNLGEAYIHGFEMINESVRQIRGESTCQVKDVERALVVGGPGYAPGSALVLGAPE